MMMYLFVLLFLSANSFASEVRTFSFDPVTQEENEVFELTPQRVYAVRHLEIRFRIP